MKHEIRITPLIFSRIADGSKTFLQCDDDRHVQQGDSVFLREFDDSPINAGGTEKKGYTGRELNFKVGFVLSTGSRAVLSLLPLDVKKEVVKRGKNRPAIENN